MSISLMVAVWDLDMDSTEKMVLMSLCDHASDEGVCWPSVATIARKCSKSERTVQAALKWLNDNKYFTFTDRPGKGRLYRLNPRRICTPAKSAPVQKTTDTPAESAPHPRRICTQTLNEPSVTLNDEVNTSSARAKADPFGAFSKPDWADADVWDDLLRNRKAKRLTNTATAYRKFLKDIEALADPQWPPGRLLEEIVARGWGAAYDPRPKDYQHGNRNSQATGRMSPGFGGGPDRRNGFEKAADRRGYGAGPEYPSGEAGRSDLGDGGSDGELPPAGARSLL